MKNYVGRKIRGFKFEDDTDGLKWIEEMTRCIGKIGYIKHQHSKFVGVFIDGYYCQYPISLVDEHLVDVDTNVDTSEKNDDTSNHNVDTFPDFRCILGTCGHNHFKVEETPEIPQPGEGILMDVSSVGHLWSQEKVIAITKDGKYLDADFVRWKMARPIQQLPKYTHAELVEKLGHDFEYGGKDE